MMDCLASVADSEFSDTSIQFMRGSVASDATLLAQFPFRIVELVYPLTRAELRMRQR